MMPVDKFDTNAAEIIVALGNASDLGLLEWVQDLNWPVARVLAPFLANPGSVVFPGIRQVLTSNDDTWKVSILNGVVAQSSELIRLLRHDLKRLASEPTPGERAEELNELALELLESK
ncbi:DUF5071 domain-containing protein [Undibacterium sp. RTI2.1]|nr:MULTISPECIES: DUF5071 domain-containing protein [unclassified Undibacterium]MEB0031252.1 DUF5071 domain-containing protein [Undibacterium sp. RTI2.1]